MNPVNIDFSSLNELLKQQTNIDKLAPYIRKHYEEYNSIDILTYDTCFLFHSNKIYFKHNSSFITIDKTAIISQILYLSDTITPTKIEPQEQKISELTTKINSLEQRLSQLENIFSEPEPVTLIEPEYITLNEIMHKCFNLIGYEILLFDFESKLLYDFDCIINNAPDYYNRVTLHPFINNNAESALKTGIHCVKKFFENNQYIKLGSNSKYHIYILPPTKLSKIALTKLKSDFGF